jgi:hypothetical protein
MKPLISKFVPETAQRAVIWYENGIETLILSTTFRGNAKDFGWLIPVPQKPQVDKSSDELYTALDDLTRPKYSVDRGPLEIPYGVTGLQEKQDVPTTPTIIETKELDVFDITILEAKDEKGLTDWLSQSSYPYPVSKEHIIKSYIEKNWYFVAVKVRSSASDFTQQALRDGHATPLKISFASDQIIYPIRLSGPGVETSQTGGKKIAAYSFEQGTEGFFGTYLLTEARNISPAEAQTQTPRKIPRVNLNLDRSSSYHGSFSLKVSATNPEEAKSIIAQAGISNLKAGKTYTLSAWAKSVNSQNGNAYLSIAGATNEQSETKKLSELGNWTRIALTFTAPSSHATIQLVGTDLSGGQTISWDAIQVEEGTQISDFDKEILPSTQPEIYPQTDQVTILLYVFADRKKELPGFTTSYASFIKPKTIEKLAFSDDGKTPWMTVKNKMYLTKLDRVMQPSEITTDFILRDADNNDPVNAESSPEISTIRFFTVIILVLAVEIGAIVFYVIRKRKKQNATTGT